jgi:Xaa-Pro aminopeptidase
VSAERLVADFRTRRVASEIVAFGEAARLTVELAERAFSNEVITPGRTSLEDVAWWLQDRLLERGLTSVFDMPSVYVTGPDGIQAVSDRTVVQPGMMLMIDWGVSLMNFATDIKRIAYVLKPGEYAVPASFQQAFDHALEVQRVMRRHIQVGRTGQETLDHLHAQLEGAGFSIIEFNRPKEGPSIDVVIGCHPVGNTGHGQGPSITTWQPLQSTFTLVPTHMFSFEFFTYTPIPEWGGRKLRIPLEDNALLTEQGVEWLHAPNRRILLIGQ